MTGLPSQGQIALANLDKDGKAPDRRIKSARDAQDTAWRLVDAGKLRSWWNGMVMGMLQGNPPYNDAKRREAGLSSLPNINFMEGKGHLSAACTPYYDLFSGAKYYAEVDLDHDNEDERVTFSKIATEEQDATLKYYYPFNFHMQAMIHDFVAFGRGFLMWMDDKDWRFKKVSQWRVFVEDGAESNTDELEILVIRQSFKVHQLWGAIRGRQSAKDAGWNEAAVVQAIKGAMPIIQGDTAAEPSYEYCQQRLKDKDLAEGVRCSTVQAVHLFVREFSGKITHLIVEETSGTRVSDDSKPPIKQQFLFEKVERFDKLCEVLSTFFFEIGDASWNGTRGMGNDIYSVIELNNRLNCEAVKMAFLRTGINIQARTSEAMQTAALVQVGAFNLIPRNFEVHPATIIGDMAAPVEMAQELRRILESNTGVYRPTLQQEPGNPKSATEVKIKYSNATVLTNSAVDRFYGQLDPMYTELYKRLVAPQSGSDEGSKLAKEFQDRCVKRGVPIAVLRKFKCVRAYRNIGNGSPAMRQQTIQETSGLVPMLPEQGRQNWIDDAITVSTHQGMERRWNPKPPQAVLPEEQVRAALVENAMMKQGAPVMRIKTDDDFVHAQVHLQAADSAAGSLEKGAQPTEVADFLDAIGPHVAQHFQGMGQDPTRKKVLTQMVDHWQQLAGVLDKLHKLLQQQAQQQQEQMRAQQQAQAMQNGTDPDLQIKQAEVQAKIGMASQKTASALQQKQQKHQQALQISSENARQRMALADATTANSIENENRRAEAAKAE